MEVAEQLLKLRPDLPVLLYTGYSNEVNAEQVSQAGIRALINKPVDTARLHELIRQVLSPRASSS